MAKVQSGQLSTPRKRPCHWMPSHSTASVPELATSKVSDLTAFDHVGTDLTLTLTLTLTRHRPQAVGGLDRSGAC